MSSGRKSELHHEGWKNRPPFIAVDIEEFMATYRPKFTTSAKAAEERREERSDLFSDNVKVKQGTRPQSRSRVVESRGMKPVSPEPPKMPMTDRQKRMMWPK